MGKLNFTVSLGEQLHCVLHNFTFATAKTSLTEKEQTHKVFYTPCVFALSTCLRLGGGLVVAGAYADVFFEGRGKMMDVEEADCR